jgi:hypothetical protein
MKKLMVASLGLGALILATASFAPAQAPGGGMVHQDQYPVMTQAITQLQQIKAQLSTQTAAQTITQLEQVRHAVNDEAGVHYKGHREHALHIMDGAIAQLKQGHTDKAGNGIDKAVAQLQQGVAAAQAMGEK